MPITQDQLVGLTKQVFMLEYLVNGLFPCQSSVFQLIRAKKREWKFNDKFEYRMLFAVTNTGGTLNSQVYNGQTLGLNKPGQLEYGTYRATYGNVTDGFEVDMMINLETKEKVASFENDYATRMHSLRTNVASLAKNFGIHGQFGVVHQLRETIDVDFPGGPTDQPGAWNPVPNIGTATTHGGTTGGGVFSIKTPINVFQSNFRTGKLLIKTTDGQPWAPANVAELYMVLDNQPGYLTLLSVGTSGSAWNDGDFLEVAQNREIVGAPPTIFQNWNWGAITVAAGPYAGTYDQFAGTGAYTSGTDAIVGAMEGLADMFPWYTDPPVSVSQRLGLDLPYRDQPNRLKFSTEQAGGWIYQRNGEHIIDAIMRGVMLTKNTVPYAEIMMYMNEVTRQSMAYEEADNVRVIRDNLIEGPIIYQRGVKSTDYQVGNAIIREVVEDNNMPTDVILIGPKLDIAYNCWDNSIFQIDDYIQETWSKQKPPPLEDLAIPDEFLTKLDLSNRIAYGPPTMTDGGMANFTFGNRIRHPKNAVNVALSEMGALFTEYPYTYTVVKLQKPICELVTT
jgi:hypothetical protein